MRVLFSFFVSLLVANAVFASTLIKKTINQEISEILADCQAVMVDDLIACPEVYKYSYPSGLSMEGAIKLLNGDQLSYSPKRVQADEAVHVWTRRIEGYKEIMKDEGESSQDRAKIYGETTGKIVSILKAMASKKGSTVLVDRDTYWAPSVNATAAFVINPLKSTIYIFVIGDTDG